MRKRIDPVQSCLLALIASIWMAPANAALYLLIDIGDTEPREAGAAAESLALARQGNKPVKINEKAERYFVHMPHATTEVISGNAQRVGAPVATVESTAAVVETAMDASMAGAAQDEDTGDTGWIEYTAAAATLMFFSPDGLDEESQVRYEPARIFVRRFDDNEVYLMITGNDGSPP